jgi:RNA polymerase sigma-70 factor (ECF subfamily)
VTQPGFETVLAAAQAGSDWAITVLYRQFNPPLRRFLDAQASGAGEDLNQEVWLAAASHLTGFTGDERAFRAWLFTIARRRLIEHWRRLGRRPSVAVAPDELAVLGGASSGDGADDAVLARAAIAELIAGLPADQAEVVLLRVVGGLSAEEVGAIVGKRAGAVRVLQHRALRRLARRVSEEPVTT